MPFHLDIVTPERKVFSEQVDEVVLPGAEGELGLRPGHAALVTAMVAGELTYRKSGSSVSIAVGHGFAEVTEEKVVVLTDVAFEEDAIDEEAVAEAIERAEKELAEVDPEDAEERAAMQRAIAASMAQLALKKKRRG